MYLANYGASEVVRGEMHQMFGSKNAQILLEDKTSFSLTIVCAFCKFLYDPHNIFLSR